MNRELALQKLRVKLIETINDYMESIVEDDPFGSYIADSASSRMADAAVNTLQAMAEHEDWLRREGYTADSASPLH